MDGRAKDKIALADEVRRRLRLARLYQWSHVVGPYSGEGFDVVLLTAPDDAPSDRQIATLCPDIRVKAERGRWERT